MIDIKEISTEMANKWGTPKLRAFVEAGIDMYPYFADLAVLVHERVAWEDLEYVLDCMLPVKAVEVANEKY